MQAQISTLIFILVFCTPAVADIQPLLSLFCVDCHGPDEQNSNIDFSSFDDERIARRQRKLWRKAIAQIDAGLMPPSTAVQPTPEQRDALLTWMQHAVKTIDHHDPANRDPGPLLMRRLTLAEYNNTIRDLIGFEYDGAVVGMTEISDAGNRFGNLSAALDISPSQMDKYFAAAHGILDRLFATELSSSVDGQIRERARASREAMFGLNPGAWRKAETKVEPAEGVEWKESAESIISTFARQAYRRPVEQSDIAPLMKLFEVSSKQGNGYVESVRLALKAVLVSPHFLYRLETHHKGDAGDVIPVSDIELASRLSYFLWSSMPDKRLLELAERGLLSQAGPSIEPVPFRGSPIRQAGFETHQGNNHERVFDGDPLTFLDGPDHNSYWIGLDFGNPVTFNRIRFAPRPTLEGRMIGGVIQASSTADFSENVVEIFAISEAPQKGWTTRELDSPLTYQFVRYLPPPNAFGNISELEIWGMAPGTVLEQQVERMLADPKAKALTEQFAMRWLQLDQLSTARPSTEYFPTFNWKMRQAMYEETFTFFDRLRQDDGNLLDLLDADYTFANEILAAHYGIDGVSGKDFTRVSLTPEQHRGGLLGMGSVLAITSHTSRTSPTLRGKWILETLFGTSPPPPPANVSQLDEANSDTKEPLTFREKLAQHAHDASCAACHRRMDPLGFALDNYNAVGQWRLSHGSQPLDVSGLLPNGESFAGVDELKGILVNRQDEFLRNLTEQMLMYALGRELDFYDDGPVRKIVQELEQNNHRLSVLVSGIINSYQFRHRLNTDHSALTN
jgi:hypothetical protein